MKTYAIFDVYEFNNVHDFKAEDLNNAFEKSCEWIKNESKPFINKQIELDDYCIAEMKDGYPFGATYNCR